MKIENVPINREKPKTTLTAEIKPPVGLPDETDFLGESRNEEFALFRDENGKTWAFPRGHLVSAKMKDMSLCELNFRTHAVVFGGPNSSEVFSSLLDGKVCTIVAGAAQSLADHMRSVETLKVNETAVELKTKKV